MKIEVIKNTRTPEFVSLTKLEDFKWYFGRSQRYPEDIQYVMKTPSGSVFVDARTGDMGHSRADYPVEGYEFDEGVQVTMQLKVTE